MFPCGDCDRSFTRKYNLLRHQRESCVARHLNNYQAAKRLKINDGASTSSASNTTCTACDISVPTNKMASHLRTQEHKANCCVNITEGVNLIRSAFKNRIASYRVHSVNNHNDYTKFFNDIKDKVVLLLEKSAENHKTTKVNMEVFARYILPTGGNEDIKSFNTSNIIIDQGTDIHAAYDTFVDGMFSQTTEFSEKDSENEITPQPPPQVQPVEDESYDDEEEEEEDESNRYMEIDMSFTEFIQRLPHPKIVRACTLALQNFDTNPVNTNHCIVKLLHRIAFDCKMYVMVFQISLFRIFQKIFRMKEMPQHKELVKFATYIMRQFFKLQENNKHVFMECLFWKSKREAYEIEHNYESFSEKSSSTRWTDEQEDELRRLFMEHKNNNLEHDVVDWIVDNLIDNTRSRRVVLRKLKDMSLIVDGYKRKKSGVKAKDSQTWGAEEEAQLRELYEEFNDAPDPLGCIMARLEITRPKNRIIEKMLIMGLIQDKKELRKKRVKKSNAGGRKSKKSQQDSGSESQGSDSDLDDNIIFGTSGVAGTNATRRQHAKKQISKAAAPSKNKKPSRKKTPAAGRDQLVKHLLTNMNSGRQEALDWLKESLSDAIEDFEDGNNDGIPLVPIMDYAQEAMENTEFQEMLKAFGICEPFDEQEAYWRIPGHLTVEKLKGFCTIIQEALDNNLTTAPENSLVNNDESSDDEDLFEKLRNMRKQSEPVENTQVGDPVDSPVVDPFDSLKENTDTSNKLPSTEGREENAENEAGNTSFGRKKSRIRNTIESDSEEETISENFPNENLEEDGENVKRSRPLSDSDSEVPTTKRSRIIDSDED